MIDRVKKETDMMHRHMRILNIVDENGPVGIVKLSDETGYPRHKIRYSLRVLEQEELIEPTNKGAKVTGEMKDFKSKVNDEVDELIDMLEDFKFEG